MKLETIKAKFSDFFSEFNEHQILMASGSLAYTTGLALSPFILIFLSFIALLNQSYQSDFYNQLSNLLGAEAGNAIKMVVENADNDHSDASFSGLFGFLILAVSASAVVNQLRTALDLIDETEVEKQSLGVWGFIKEKIFSVGLVFGFIFLSITSLIVTTFVSGWFVGTEETLWTILSFVISTIVFWLLFTNIFRFVPSTPMRWRDCMFAGAITTVTFLIGKFLIGVYLGNAAIGSAYGAAGSLVVFLVWVYYAALTILGSYQLTRFIFLNPEDQVRKTTKRL